MSGLRLGVTAAAAGILLESRCSATDPGCEVCLGTGTVPWFCTRFGGASPSAGFGESAGTARNSARRSALL